MAWMVYGLSIEFTPMRIVCPAVRMEVCTPNRYPLTAIASAPDCQSNDTSCCRSASVTTRICPPDDSRGSAPSTAIGSASVRVMPSPSTGSMPLLSSS